MNFAMVLCLRIAALGLGGNCGEQPMENAPQWSCVSFEVTDSPGEPVICEVKPGTLGAAIARLRRAGWINDTVILGKHNAFVYVPQMVFPDQRAAIVTVVSAYR